MVHPGVLHEGERSEMQVQEEPPSSSNIVEEYLLHNYFLSGLLDGGAFFLIIKKTHSRLLHISNYLPLTVTIISYYSYRLTIGGESGRA